MPSTDAHYRAPMRSRRDDVERYAGVERALRHALCGIGGRLAPPPSDLPEAVAITERTYGERQARRLHRFAAVPVGAFVWTQDEDGAVQCGRLSGPWSYDASPEAYAVDLVHVRPCSWEPMDDELVPPAVQATFRRGGRNFQRITSLGGTP